MTDPIDRVQELFGGVGGRAYLGEDVTIATHMLQAAARAEAAGAGDALVAAALLHDVGYLLGAREVDHPVVAARWLAHWLPSAVTEPVLLHVEAKRYLCAVDGAYVAALSSESIRTLALQGGPLSPDAAAEFAAGPHGAAAVAVRRWDDGGKVTGVTTGSIDLYRDLLGSLRQA
ncbi:MAG: HD domain-containing protein [Frankia sp.]